jgi:protein-S-isoprenylcysteine O-methyltransferase Ste14
MKERTKARIILQLLRAALALLVGFSFFISLVMILSPMIRSLPGPWIVLGGIELFLAVLITLLVLAGAFLVRRWKSRQPSSSPEPTETRGSTEASK